MMVLAFVFGLLFINSEASTVALVIGGHGGGTSTEIVTETNICKGQDSNPKIPDAPVGNLAGWFAEYADNLLYLCGGQDSEEHSECHTLRIGSQSWTVAACKMNAERRNSASTVMPDGRVVVLGGYSKNVGWLDMVEVKIVGRCEFIQKDSWKMPRKMFDFCAVAVNETHIFIAGGSMYGQPQTDQVDILDTTTGTWTSMAPLPTPRAASACLATKINGEEGILVTGGFNAGALEHYKDALFYSIATNTWKKLEDMNQKRMGHGMHHVGESVMVIGGYEQNLLGSIEVYTPGVGWTMHPGGSLNFARVHFGGTEIPNTLLTC